MRGIPRTLLGQLIQQSEWTYEEWAERISRLDSRATISARHLGRLARAERGKPAPTPATRRALAAAFDRPVEELLALWPVNRDSAHDDGTTAPAETSTASSGSLVSADVDRRRYLQGLIAASVGGAFGLATERTLPAARVVDPAVIDHFARLRALLVDADNLLGPHYLLGTVHQQLVILDGLRLNVRGPLRRAVLTAQSRWAEFAGWLCDDTGDSIAGRLWVDQAMEMAQEADDPVWIGYILARKAQRAGRENDANRVVGLAAAAQRTPALPALVRAFACLQQAYGHALAGDSRDCEAAIAVAHELVTTTWEPAELGGFCTPSYVLMHEADCWMVQRKPTRAVRALEAALPVWPGVMERDRGLCLARLAAAHLAGRHPEPIRAAVVAQQALNVGTATGSVRILTGLQDVASALSPWRAFEGVDAFLDAIATVGRRTDLRRLNP